MVKEVPVSISITGCTALDYYNAIYAEGGAAFKQYHKEHSSDPCASVSAWDEGKRQVKFRMTLNLPQLLKKAIGTECIEVLETQSIKWHGDNRFTIESEPNLNFPGSNKFTTKGKTTVYTVNGSTCQVDAVLICSANMPWPMQSTVESAMASEAQAGVTKFLKFALAYCLQAKAQVAKEPSPAPPELDEMLFYDASDDAAALSSMSSGSSEGALVAASSSVSAPRTPTPGLARPVTTPSGGGVASMQGAGNGTEEALLQAVRALQHTSQAMCVSLAEVVAQLRMVNEQVGALRATLAPGSRTPAVLTNGPSMSTSYSSGPSSQARLSAPSYVWWLTGLAAGASAAGIIYLRSRQRGG